MIRKTLLLLLGIFFVLSCSKEKKLRLAEKNFTDEVPLKGALAFTFNKDVIPDSLKGIWTDKAYMNIEPEVEGKYSWQNPNKIVFIPTEGYKPATNYKVKFNKEMFKYSKNDYNDVDEFNFHTPYLDLLSSRAYWEKSDDQNIQGIKVDLGFNYKVIPSELEKLLTLKINDKPKTYKVVTEEISDKVSIIITGVEKEDKDYPLEISIEKGLSPGSGGESTLKSFVKQFDIPSPFKLNITDIQASHDGNEGSITLYTTQEVNGENIKDYINIEPKIRYSVDIQSGYFTIKSEFFSIESKYEITIKKGLKGKLDGELKYDFSQPVSFGKIRPTIHFVDKKEYYLSGNGSRNIEVAIINVPNVRVKIWKVYENNIIRYLNSGGYYYYDYDYEYDNDYYYNDNMPGDLGDVVYENEIETSTLPRKGSNRLLTFDFKDKIPEYKGIYIVEIISADNYSPRATKMVSISDIGLIVKKGNNNISVFANSIKTAQPLANVELKFIGRNNQVTHTMKTDNQGVAQYDYANQEIDGFIPVMVVAQMDNDFNVIHLDRTRVNTSRFEVGGKWKNQSGLDAFIYGDRNLYRPGETINLSAIIRDYSWKSPGNIPVIVRISSPNGRNYKTIRKILNEYGSFETQIPLLSTAQTGYYNVGIYMSNDVLIGSSVIKVEEFMPDRIKVNVELDKESYKPGDDVKVSLEALNLFGPPAANRNYEVEMSTQKVYFYPKKNRDYNYGLRETNNYFNKIFKKGSTDEQGKADEIFDIPREYRDMGILSSDVFVTVFDETGRPVNRLLKYKTYTQDVFFGIRCSDYYIKTGQPVKLDLIAVNKDGDELKDIEAEIELIRIEYKTVLSKSGEYFRYRSERVENVLEKKKIKVNETATTFGFIPEISGQYEFRIKKPGVSAYVANNLYSYGWGSTTYSSFKVNNEGQIDIETDKEKYNVGDKAKILLKAPFTGKMLISIETDKVLDHFYIETDKRAASFELDIKEEYLPNVYISATLFRPHEETDIPLTVANGYQCIKVDNPDYKIPVSITTAKTSRSNTKQKIRVKSRPNSPVTIAVVDEGILQVAGYSTPDPYGFYYQKRALQVYSSNIYPYLFPEVNAIRSNTGGGDGEMQKRLNPFPNKRVKLVSFWSGIVTTDSKGEAEYEIDIPQFSGDLRIMAVGYDENKFGSAQENMKVADPLVISVALPRFLSPGDKIDVKAVLTNTTEKDGKCKATLKLSGPLKNEGESVIAVSIPSNSEAEVNFKVDAGYELGNATVTLEADALGETFINTTDITIRPASPLQKRSGGGTIKVPQNQQINVDINNFMSSSIHGKLIVSKNPMVQFTKSLDYLVGYPYGCVEQTVSRAFPQIYFSDLLGISFTEKRAANDAVHNVQVALDRIKLMQLYNGGLTYWPGEGIETWWGSAYAAHFTLEAKKAGYEVDEDFLNRLLKYLKKQLQEKKTITYYYNHTFKKEIAPKEVAYSLYILTMAGEKPKALMNYYRNRTSFLSIDSKYLLAGAYILIGDSEKAKDLLPEAFEGEESNTSFGGSFYSYIRDEAIALNVMLEVDPDNPQVGIMAKHVSDVLMNRRYLNTQERCFGFLAMGKIAKMAANSNIKAEITSGGKKIAVFDNKDLNIKIDNDTYKPFEIKTEGNGNLYYYWETEGITADGSFLEEDSYIQVRKDFYDRNGNYISGNTFKQNDLVLVQISITGLTNTYVENVAISDILPACFEIENPRITTIPSGMDFPHSRSRADYMDIRDDRINLFTKVGSGTKYFYYLVRVVSTGNYIMGPVGADAMYNGEYHSYNGSGKIIVTR